MGSMISSAFIPPDELLGCTEDGCLPPELSREWCFGFVQVLMLMAGYGYILFFASNLLSDGSELLLLVPSLAGIVGSVVLPILGAVPDGAIMLFSGLGPDAQEQMQVGVGALAGSTIMLLTIPWGGCIFAGAMPINKSGDVVYSKKAQASSKKQGLLTKLGGHGVTPDGTIRTNAFLMVATSLCYLIIQGPAFAYARDVEGGEGEEQLNTTVASTEHWWSLAGLIASLLAFCIYIGVMVKQSQVGGGVQQKLIDDVIIRELENHARKAKNPLTISGLIGPIISESISRYATVAMPTGLQESLLAERDKHRLRKLLAPFFSKYDVDNDGRISQTELVAFLNDLGERPTRAETAIWMQRLDTDNTGSIEQEELVDSLMAYVKAKVEQSRGWAALPLSVDAPAAAEAEEEEEEEEEAEMPEDLEHLSPQQQQAMIKSRAFRMMTIGTLLVVIFSDPMVDVMANVGARLQIPPFYVAFTLAPLASNASEFIASLAYAGKKSKKTITVALAALEGAACMNNTFCLSIFMGLCYFKGLAWKFAAETSTTLLVELLLAIFAMRKTQTCCDALLILSLFPLSIGLVAFLEAVGFD